MVRPCKLIRLAGSSGCGVLWWCVGRVVVVGRVRVCGGGVGVLGGLGEQSAVSMVLLRVMSVELSSRVSCFVQ